MNNLGAVRHVILDRDGVLNEELDGAEYLDNPAQFRWLPGVLGSLATLHSLGARVSVATNQSGIGRGLVTELQLGAIHRKMRSDATNAYGSIDAIYHCPHAPDANCACRKPAPGLIVKAIADSNIAAGHTLVIGDACRDLEAARSAGVEAVLVRTGKGRLYESYAAVHGIAVYDDLGAIVADLAKHAVAPLDDDLESLQVIFAEHTQVVSNAATHIIPLLSQCIGVTRRCLRAGNKVLACGNGGSASDAQHFVAELVGRYQHARGPLPAIALGSDAATITAVANDFGFDQVFARQVAGLARRGDVLLALSTSGNSRNVINAAIAARERGCTVIALTGQHGGELAQHADLVLRVPSVTVARIQEVHGLCLHSIAQAIDSVASESDPTSC